MEQEYQSSQSPGGQNTYRAADDPAHPPEKKKKKRSTGKTVLTIVIWLLVIALVIFLTLFIASKIGQFESIPDLITYIRSQLSGA